MKYNNYYIKTSFDNIKKLQALGYSVSKYTLNYNYIFIVDNECYGRNMIPNCNKIVEEELIYLSRNQCCVKIKDHKATISSEEGEI